MSVIKERLDETDASLHEIEECLDEIERLQCRYPDAFGIAAVFDNDELREQISEERFTGSYPGAWHIYDGNTRHDYYWHRHQPGHDDWMSIWADEKRWGEWWIEIYPYIDSESPTLRTSHDTKTEAAIRVAKLMQKYSEDEQ
jgi:hypothetical protein